MHEIKLLSWNIFHGRDFPPNPGLSSRRSKLLGLSQADETHIQVNRDLLAEFTSVLAEASWDVAMLQECPPRWRRPLAAACGAEVDQVLTSRNSLGFVRTALARRNPDLMGSWEGGSNLTLVRPSAGRIIQSRPLVLNRGRPERRTLIFTRLSSGICIANFHASTVGRLATREISEAARRTRLWAGRDRLVLAGDFNLRPQYHEEFFASLADNHDLGGPTDPDSLDHILIADQYRGEPTVTWPPGDHEVNQGRLKIRLSDHFAVEATIDALLPPSG